MKIRKIVLGIAILTFFSTSYGLLSGSGPYYLDNGIIPPNGELFIPISSKLPPNRHAAVQFQIECDIINSNYKKNYPIVLQLGTAHEIGGGSSEQFYLNGKGLGYPNNQCKLDQLTNHLVIRNFTPSYDKATKDRLYFISFDDSDSASVENCVITYQT